MHVLTSIKRKKSTMTSAYIMDSRSGYSVCQSVTSNLITYEVLSPNPIKNPINQQKYINMKRIIELYPYNVLHNHSDNYN